jgi:undecaprenyl-diphosphatase
MKKLKSLAHYLYSFARQKPFDFSVLLICLGLIYVFMGLVDEVFEGDSHDIDTKILLMMRTAGNLADPIGPPWVEEMVRDITALGGTIILTFMTIACAFYLFATKKASEAWFLLASVSIGILISNSMKIGFSRPRPDLVPHDSITSMASFPSGHSLMAAVVYLSLGALIAESQSRTVLKIYVMSLAIIITILVGISRIYLGVHWPSDVLAGWIAGSAWAMAVWLIWVRITYKGRKNER